VLDALPEPQPVFRAIQERGGVALEDMYLAFNMGVGFTITVEPGAASKVLAILGRHGFEAQVIGHAVSDPRRLVRLPGVGLVGDGEARRYVRGGS
jgi:phosphoribosylaminoimidazole (AIR) synthetase